MLVMGMIRGGAAGRESTSVFCRSCGENIPVDSVFCPHCGKNLLEIATPKPTDSGFTLFGITRQRTRLQASEDWSEDESAEDAEEGLRGSKFDWGWLERMGLPRVFWIMGLVFAAVGFVVGVGGNTAQAIVWILFGLALLIAAPQAVQRRDNDQPDAEEVSE
jgi:hypothetical protein